MSGRTHWKEILELLVDPIDLTPLTFDADSRHLTGAGGRTYEIVDDQPVLLSPDSRTSSTWKFPSVAAGQQLAIRSNRSLSRRILGQVKRKLRADRDNADTTEQIASFLADRPGDQRNVVIVGGGTIGAGSKLLFQIPNVKIISFDVYGSANTTFVADAHQSPLASGTIDAVWIQAVLEHVVEPSIVVAELARLLVDDGLMYAETPFLQPVHEGPFDFTRFSHSGHRLLFGAFDEIDSGPIGGPGAVLALAVRGVAGGLTRSQRIARLAYGLASGLGSLDRLIPREWRVDYATGTYFLGKKTVQQVSSFDASGYYEGAQ